MASDTPTQTPPFVAIGRDFARTIFGPAQDAHSTVVLSEAQLASLLTKAAEQGARRLVRDACTPENQRN